MKKRLNCRGIMFGTYDLDKERYTLNTSLKEAMIEAIIQYCWDVDIPPEGIEESFIYDRLYDLTNYANHVAEELYIAFKRNSNRVKTARW